MISLAFLTGTTVSYAQLSKEQIKERQEAKKLTQKELNEKATKAARKAAKEYQKDGWQVAPGALPIEKQLDRAYIMENTYDEDMFPKYIKGEAMSIGGNYDAAKMQALELAKLRLAGNIQTEVVGLAENNMENVELDKEEAISSVKTVLAGKNLIKPQSIGRVITAVEMYRKLQNKNIQVSVTIYYNSDMAKAAAKKAIREELEKKGEELQGKLDDILGW